MNGATQSSALQDESSTGATSAGLATTVSSSTLTCALEEILERSDPAARAVIAFDADGTLWNCDVGEMLFESALAARLIRAEAGDALRALAQRHTIADSGSACELAARLYRAYHDSVMSEHDCAEMLVWCYAGWSRSALAEYAAEVLSAAKITPHHFAPTIALLGWARARGVRCIVVSASPAVAVEAAVRSCGIDAQDVFAGRLKPAGEAWTAALDGPLPWGEQKAVLGSAAVGDGLWLASCGDSAFDLELLKRARVAVAVRAKPALRALFGEMQGPLYELVET